MSIVRMAITRGKVETGILALGQNSFGRLCYSITRFVTEAEVSVCNVEVVAASIVDPFSATHADIGG